MNFTLGVSLPLLSGGLMNTSSRPEAWPKSLVPKICLPLALPIMKGLNPPPLPGLQLIYRHLAGWHFLNLTGKFYQ